MKKHRMRKGRAPLAMNSEALIGLQTDFNEFFQREMLIYVREQDSFDKKDQKGILDLLNRATHNTQRMRQKEFNQSSKRNLLFTKLLSFRNSIYEQLLTKAQSAVKQGELPKDSYLGIKTLIESEVRSLSQIIGDDLVSRYKTLTPREFVKYFHDHRFAEQALFWIIDHRQKGGMGWLAACGLVLDEMQSGGFPGKNLDSFQRNMRKAKKHFFPKLK